LRLRTQVFTVLYTPYKAGELYRPIYRPYASNMTAFAVLYAVMYDGLALAVIAHRQAVHSSYLVRL